MEWCVDEEAGMKKQRREGRDRVSLLKSRRGKKKKKKWEGRGCSTVSKEERRWSAHTHSDTEYPSLPPR
jgi:hypothetical protein